MTKPRKPATITVSCVGVFGPGSGYMVSGRRCTRPASPGSLYCQEHDDARRASARRTKKEDKRGKD